MLNKILKLFYELYSLDKEAQNRGRRLAERAIYLGLNSESIATCYLYEALSINYDSYYETLESIKDIDENVAKLVDKITKKKTESFAQYFYRISVIPEASQIVWLIVLQKLEDCNMEDFMIMHAGMERIFRGIHKHIS